MRVGLVVVPTSKKGLNCAIAFVSCFCYRSCVAGKVTVLLHVTIDPSGSLREARIYQSSNNMAIDQAAVAAARKSSYVPKIVGCQPVVGPFLRTV